MKFIKPYEINDWEYIIVVLGKPKYSNNARNNTLPVVKAGTYTIQWPDGTVEDAKVIMRPYTATVHDMGQQYSVEGEKPYIEVNHHGTKTWVYLPNAGCKVGISEKSK